MVVFDMTISPAPSRSRILSDLQSQTFDLLVIGGGATGAGIALDAASRGMSVALVEKLDFAFGTSSRSTKLIHGGLRYLKQFEIKLVREVGQERAIVHKLAPHLVVSEPMLLPLIKGGTYGRLATSFGLKVYDFLAGVSGKDRRKMLSKATTLKKAPLLRDDVLLGGGLYAEYRTDDARLTVENVKAAMHHGAVACNYAEVKDFLYDQGIVQGAVVEDGFTGDQVEVRARQVVSAAGPWVDELRKKNQSMNEKRLFLSKGVHLVVPHERFPLDQSVYFDVPDGRMIFAIPRGKVTYIGTTDTEYKADKERPRTNQEDVDYLLEATNSMFPEVNLRQEDVVSSWAGLRPLIYEEGKSASEISRKDEVFISDSRLVSIAGGKLTGYRKMAERVVDTAADQLAKHFDKSFGRCRTKSIDLAGGGLANSKEVKQYQGEVAMKLQAAGLTDPYLAQYLVHLYGKQTDLILAELAGMEQQNEAALIRAELAFALKYELVFTAADFLVRRTGRLYFDIDSVRQYRDLVIGQMARQYDWDETEQQTQRNLIDQEVEEVSTFPKQAASVPA